MKRIPYLFNSEEVQKELVLSTRSDKHGNIFHYVEYLHNDGSKDFARFSHLSSVVDFINSNFQK